MSQETSRALLRWMVVVMLASALWGCASSPVRSPAKARLSVLAQPDVNPDAGGRPSPVVVRVYQLQSDTKFAEADFFALFDTEQQVLGEDLLSREEVTLAPGERKPLHLEVKDGVKFIGAVAAYRDIRNSRWRVLQPAPTKNLLDVFRKDRVQVDVARDRVSVTIYD